MSIKNLLGKRIQELRLKKNMKQAELAEYVGIATKHQSCIETGKNFPSAELLEKYATALNIDISELLNIKHIINRVDKIDNINKMISTASDEELTIIYKFLNSLIN